MPYLFGAANNDTINLLTTQANIFNPDSGNLVNIWFYPTSLTAGRYLWHFNDTNLATGNGVSIDTTTTRLRYQNAAGGLYILTGVENITVDRWWFLSIFVLRDNTNSRDVVRAWLGNESTAPLEMTVSITTNAASVTASALTIGNGGGGSLAFNGLIGQTSFLHQRQVGLDLGSAGGIFPLNTRTAISQAEADLIYERWTKYFWLGNPRFSYISTGSKTVTNNLDITRFFYTPMNGNLYYRFHSDLLPSYLATGFTTLTGATLSASREPNPLVYNWLMNDKLTPRRR